MGWPEVVHDVIQNPSALGVLVISVSFGAAFIIWTIMTLRDHRRDLSALKRIVEIMPTRGFIEGTIDAFEIRQAEFLRQNYVGQPEYREFKQRVTDVINTPPGSWRRK